MTEIRCASSLSRNIIWNVSSRVAVLLILIAEFSSAELRLGGGPTPREGWIEVAYENNIQPGKWASVCGDGWTNEDAIVACNEAGFPGPAVAVRHATERYGESYLSVLLTNVDCEPDAPDLLSCRNTTFDVRPCRTGREAGAICQMPGYEGCFKMATVSLPSDAFMVMRNMTVDICLAFCINQTIQLAGVSSDNCHCWNQLPNTTTDLKPVAHHHCVQHCPGDQLQLCGGTKGLLKTFAIYDTYVGFCMDPGLIANGFRDSDWFKFGATVEYQCDEGYMMYGRQNISCVESGPGYDWNDATPMCERVPMPTTPPPTTAGPAMNGETKIEFMAFGITGAGVGILLFILLIAFAIACCKSRKKRPKKLVEDDDEEAQMSKLKGKKKKKKAKKVKKKHKEKDDEEKDKDEMEMALSTDDELDKKSENEGYEYDDDDDDDDDIVVSENKANAKLDTGPIATADHSYYETDVDQRGSRKSKPLPSARGQGRPTSSSKPAKFNFIETEERKSAKRRGLMKNVLFVRHGGGDADVLLKDAK